MSDWPNVLFVFWSAGAIAVPDGLWRDGQDLVAFPLRLAAGLRDGAKGHWRPARPSTTRIPRGKTFSIDVKTFVYTVDATIITFQFGETLKKMYLAAQTIAVGLEQVILDRAVYGGDYLEQFATTENKLAMVISLKYISNLPKINALLLGTLLFANVVDGETRRAGRRRRPPVDGQQIPRHAQRVRSQFARFHHHEGLHQLARVHPASVASFSKSMNFYLLKCLFVWLFIQSTFVSWTGNRVSVEKKQKTNKKTFVSL